MTNQEIEDQKLADYFLNKEDKTMNNTAEQINTTTTTGLKAILRKAQKPAEEVKKGKTPLLDATEEAKKLAQQILDNKKKMDNAKTDLERDTALLTSLLSNKRKELCQREYTSSIRVPTANGNSILIVWSGNYVKITTDKEDELIRIVGDKYQDYFKSRFVITAEDKSDDELYTLFGWLSPDGGETPEGLQMGQERFAQFFTVDEVIKPTERFVHDHVLMSDSKRADLEAAGVRQYKPSIKTR